MGVIFGQVVGVHLNSNIINKDGKVDLKKINVVARLGYNEYTLWIIYSHLKTKKFR